MKILIGKQYSEELEKYIFSAKAEIKISMYDWRWYLDQSWNRQQRLNKQLVDAKRRGVQIHCSTNADRNDKIFKEMGFTVHRKKSKRTLHTKIVYIDRKYLFIGSHNLTQNAHNTNVEISIFAEIEGTEVAERLDLYFKNMENL